MFIGAEHWPLIKKYYEKVLTLFDNIKIALASNRAVPIRNNEID
jgi:hypothetical protein